MTDTVPPHRVRFAAARPLLLAVALSMGCAGHRSKEAPASTPTPDAPAPESPQPEAPPAEEWIALFNGRDLAGWTPKFTGHALGENLHDTFRVEDGVLKVAYDGWDGFRGEFGHLYYEQPLSEYRLRIEYRFVGEQVRGGPGWALRNSGVMLHGQDPRTLALDQEFPCSIEAQMLGGDGDAAHTRSTANLCTPGTNVELNGELVTRHCTNSSSATYHGDGWVVMELEVRGNEVIRHWMDGAVVLEYQRPQLDPNDAHAAALLAAGNDLQLSHGTISLQAESHPLEVRRIEVLPLTSMSSSSAR
jgi:hypothetical protein